MSKSGPGQWQPDFLTTGRSSFRAFPVALLGLLPAGVAHLLDDGVDVACGAHDTDWQENCGDCQVARSIKQQVDEDLATTGVLDLAAMRRRPRPGSSEPAVMIAQAVRVGPKAGAVMLLAGSQSNNTRLPSGSQRSALMT